MSVGTSSSEVVVYKFKESGLVALCREVADLYESRSGTGSLSDVDWDSAEYRDGPGTYEIVFSYLPKDHPDKIRARALELQAAGPDEFPYDYYEYLATKELTQ